MACEIRSHRIYRDGKAVAFLRTQNAGGVITPQAIVLHDTAGDLAGKGSISWLRGGPGASQSASAHVVIGRDGTITQLAETNIKTWHAGKSSWNGRSNLNGWSIGIEIANPGGPLQDLGGGRFKGGVSFDANADPSLVVKRGQFPCSTGDGKTMWPNSGLWLEHSPQQIEAVVDLCRALVAAYPTITEIVTHWQIAPDRKVDPNPLFPLEEVRRRVFNEAKAVEAARMVIGAAVAPDAASKETVRFVQERLRALGYAEVGEVDGDMGRRTRGAILAFRGDAGIELKPAIDDALLVALARAKPRPVSERRANVTAASLAALPQIRAAGLSKLLAWLLGLPAMMAGAAQGILSQVGAAVDQLGPVKDFLGTVPGWLWALAIVGVAAAIWQSARQTEAATVQAYRDGRLT